MSSGRYGLPRAENPKHASLLYEGVEYEKFWEGQERRRQDEWEHYLVRRLLPKRGRRIVDIGCGFGRLADCYLDRFEQAVLLDGSMTLLRQAQDRLNGRAVYIAADANHLPFLNSSFDCALMIRVFHHLPDTALILSELARILEDGGAFLFDYSNKWSARQLLRRLLRRNKENPFVVAPVMSGKTLILHHPAYVRQMLARTGFLESGYFGTGVIDKLPGALGEFERWRPFAVITAQTLGFTRLAPWVMCRTRKRGKALNDDRNIEALLMCPSCHSPVYRSEQAYLCRTCAKTYPIDGGIADFRPTS